MYFEEYPDEAKIIRYLLYISFISLGIGGLFGVIQALHRTKIFRIVSSSNYYDILTGHGVLLAFVFTFTFLTAVFTWATTNSLDRSLENYRYSWGWFSLMVLGAILASIPIVAGIFNLGIQAKVLYTFYTPLSANPIFYIGLAFFVIGTWLAGFDWIRSYLAWRRENKNKRIPLPTFMVLTTFLMWLLSSLGVVAEIVLFILPWSTGLIGEIDPLLTRTLFWFTGHAIVYVWLLPAYLAWYIILPKISGGKLFSDPLARVVFILFLILSTPTGFHHQYIDPGIPEGYKFLAMTNTMFLLLPSLLTAFTVVASVEYGARKRGGKGYLKWIFSLPWSKPEFSGMVLAMIMFAAGGFSGMINAGMNINYLVHNTVWVPGHFHLTVGTAAALTFMSVSYWLLPQFTGKELSLKGLAAIQPYIWFLGVTLFSNAMHRGGLAGIPRRTADPLYSFNFTAIIGSISEIRTQIAIGGILMFISLLFFLSVVFTTLINGNKITSFDSSIPIPLSGPENGPKILDRIWLWLGIAILLVLVAYAVPLFDLIQTKGLFGPGSSPFPMFL